MNRHIIPAMALCGTLLAAASAFVPTAQAGNVSWGVSVGGPGFSVSAGQPGYYGGRGYYRAPYFHGVVPAARPYFRASYRAAFVAPPPVAFPYVVPAPIAYAPRPVFLAPRPAYYARQTAAFGSASY